MAALAKTNNTRQAMWVAIGHFCSFAIGIVSPMILSRYFSKGDYGTYKQVMYVYQSLLTIFSLGLPKAYAYFIPKVTIGESKDVINKITSLFLLLGILFSASLFFLAGPISSILKNPDLAVALKWFSPTPLLLLPVLGLDGILAAYKKTQFIAIYTISTKLFTLLCLVLPVVLFHGTYIHAIIGFDLASLLSFLLAVYLRNLPTKQVIREKSLVTYKDIFQFSIPLFTASIWGMIISSADQFFVSRYYGNSEFAEFSNGFMEFPVIPMVTGAVATVLLPLFSGMAEHNKTEMKTVWVNALTKSAKIIYPITTYCILFASLVMTCMYGNMYKNSAVYFAMKNLVAYFMIIPFFPVLAALGKTRSYSNVLLLNSILVVFTELLIVKLGGSSYAIGAASAFYQILRVVIMMSLVSIAMKISLTELVPAKGLFKIFVVTIISSVLPLIVWNLLSGFNKFILFALTGLLYVMCYYALCWLLKISYKDVFTGFMGHGKLAFLLPFIP